jgi:glycosyltransferase involved in cell wall biosynthesis
MNLYINSAKENWVVDRFIKEFKEFDKIRTTRLLFNADLIWLIAPWTWRKIPIKYLKRNKVVCTIHHIDEDKFDEIAKKEFLERDSIVNQYHVISESTYKQVSNLTIKPIKIIPFWVNQNIWFEIKNRDQILDKYKLDNKKFYIGSFQRDTEGSDLISPKLSKGPDRFIEILKRKNEEHNLCVIITGKRRNYLIKKLNEEKIEYKYFEMVSFSEINELYNILDLYIVSSRYEGGPQAILECAITRTPIISTDVGIASEILSTSSIYQMNNFHEAKPDIEYAYKKVIKYQIPEGMKHYRKLFLESYEN